MRWLIGVCLVWLVVLSFIQLLNPRYANVYNTMFYAVWIALGVAGLLVLTLGGRI